MAVLIKYKPLGFTPLQVLDSIRENDERFKNSKMVYAGRLDPMATGVLVVLTDEDRFDLDEYLGFDKTYRAEILLGVRSDSLDVLGVVKRGGVFDGDEVDVLGVLDEFLGVDEYELPIFSAYKVKGRPLHWWALSLRIDEIEVPFRRMEVFGYKGVGLSTVSTAELKSRVFGAVGLVGDGFRIEEVLESWRRVFADGDSVDEFVVITVEFDVGSGTYIRVLARELGERLGCGAILLGLERTRVGEFEI